MRTPIISVASVTVTYNTDANALANQLNSLSECKLKLIVDNSENDKSYKAIEKTCQKYDNTILIKNTHNIGIAEAQNTAIDRILKNSSNIEAILFLDDDSTLDRDCLKDMFNAYLSETKNRNKKIAAIGPTLINSIEGFEYGFQTSTLGFPRRKRNQKKNLYCDLLNSSGSLIPVSALSEIGQFRKDFFIDHVETEWCMRAQQLNYKLIGCPSAKIFHRMGERTINYWFFGHKKMPYRPPFRHYYIFRNSIQMQKLSHVKRSWKIFNIIKLILTYIFFVYIYNEKREAQKKYMKLGIIHGLKNIKNELPM